MQNVVIIGAGICGSFIAHELSRYQLSVCVIDRENDVANGVTMANSAIIHAGYDPKEGSLKAKLNVEGAQMYEQICADIGADYKKTGAYILASSQEEEQSLEELSKRAKNRGIRAEKICAKDLRVVEPNLSSKVTSALSIPDTAIISPWEVAIHLMEEAVDNGVRLYLGEEITAINKTKSHDYLLRTKNMRLRCDCIINAAGCGAEEVAALIGVPPFHLEYKRGEYFVLSKLAKGFVNHVLYPVPTKLGKGVLVVPTTHGNTLLGPTADLVKVEDLSTTKKGMAYIRKHLEDIVEHVPYQEIIRSYSGIRPCGNDGDFYIKESETHRNIIHVACIDSPGLASAPAIGKYVMKLLTDYCAGVPLKDNYKKRKSSRILEHAKAEERKQYFQEDPSFGHMICRCEHISEGEVIDAIHRPCGARSIKGVKKRVRTGMGRCQGGFCEVEVAKILARELQIPIQDVLYDHKKIKIGKKVK